MQIPKLDKIVINMGVGEAKENHKILDTAVKDLETITGQKAVITRAKNSVANFKLREGQPIGCKVTLRGKVDALSHDRHTLVEHKCKGKIDQVQTSKEVPVDHQVLLYCYITTARTVVYDLIMIPEAQWMLPARRPSQTNDNWAEQLFTSTSGEKFPIAQKKHHWVQQIGPLEINESQIYEFRAFTLDPIIERMYKWFEHVSQPDFDHTNPKFYNEHFYRVPVRHFDPGKTEIFKCDYFDYLTGSGDLDDLVPVKGFYQELSTEE